MTSGESQNLAVVLTDIVGFSEVTAKTSRAANAKLLKTHNQLLLPVVKRYRGTHVKSIGDSLLLVFSSPTDALLCAMAMQDQLYDYNLRVSEEAEIHVRIAINVGEVRVAVGDVFGDPVNVASRLEAITPADEIYLTEAVYMTMNRAEVPTNLVGEEEFKGVPEKVKVYSVPRYAVKALKAVEGEPSEQEGLTYPFGGSHLKEGYGIPKDENCRYRPLFILVILLLAAVLLYQWQPKPNQIIQPIAPQQTIIKERKPAVVERRVEPEPPANRSFVRSRDNRRPPPPPRGFGGREFREPRDFRRKGGPRGPGPRGPRPPGFKDRRGRGEPPRRR